MTEAGTNALDVIFQENKPKKIEKIPPIVEYSHQEEGEEFIAEEHEKTESAIEDQHISSALTSRPKMSNINFIQDFFNINEFVENSIPKWFYKANFIGFAFFFIFFVSLQPKFVFLHFIPVEIKDISYSLLALVFPLLNLVILFIISRLKRETIHTSTIGILFIYYNFVIIITIITNIFQLYLNNFEIRVLSILIQGLFIFFWTLSISLQYYSWEKSLFLAILQNYVLFLLF